MPTFPAGRDHPHLRGGLGCPRSVTRIVRRPWAGDGMVASCHPLASLAGVEMLKSGGNVVDAAVATNAVLAVTQPNFCGVGGDLFCLYYEAATRRVHFLNGAGRSGSRATLDELGRRGLAAVPDVGPGSVSVPGATRGWCMLLERFGTRPLGRAARAGHPLRGRGLPAHRRRRARPSARRAEPSTIRSGVASSCPAASFPQTGRLLPPARPRAHAHRAGRRARALLPGPRGARDRGAHGAPRASSPRTTWPRTRASGASRSRPPIAATPCTRRRRPPRAWPRC